MTNSETVERFTPRDALIALLKKVRHKIGFLDKGPKGRGLLAEIDAALAEVE